MRLNKLITCLALVVSCWLPLMAVADQTDDRLDPLFDALRSSQDALELVEVEAAIWDIWYQSGDEQVDAMMREAAELVRQGNLAEAEAIYTRITERLPQFSEGWNRRATVRYYQRDYDGSLADIRVTLNLEPRHFGAIWGLGMILGLQRDFERAIIAFERLLEIKPNASDARPRIELLKQELAKQAV